MIIAKNKTTLCDLSLHANPERKLREKIHIIIYGEEKKRKKKEKKKRAPQTEQVSIVVRQLQIELSPPILATTTYQTVTHFITTTYQSVHDPHITHKPKTKKLNPKEK